MKCADLEILLCDYVDGTLSAAERATVELHLAQCAECRELVELSTAAVSFIERASAPEPPAALVNQILFEARKTQAANPAVQRSTNWLKRFFEPILQPKFAMGMAMTILSFSMLGRFAGIKKGEIRAADLEPARIWASIEDKALRTWDRAQKYYESLRLVYEVRQALRDWNENEDPAPAGRATEPGAGQQAAPAVQTPAPAGQQSAPAGQQSAPAGQGGAGGSGPSANPASGAQPADPNAKPPEGKNENGRVNP